MVKLIAIDVIREMVVVSGKLAKDCTSQEDRQSGPKRCHVDSSCYT